MPPSSFFVKMILSFLQIPPCDILDWTCQVPQENWRDFDWHYSEFIDEYGEQWCSVIVWFLNQKQGMYLGFLMLLFMTSG